jgi:hypothetical protein
MLSKKMIDGSSSLKVETINIHEKSQMHQHAMSIQENTIDNPSEAPAVRSTDMFDAKTLPRVALKFRNAHAIIKNRRPFRDYIWLCDLDEAKGLDVGDTYRNPQKAQEMGGLYCQRGERATRNQHA